MALDLGFSDEELGIETKTAVSEEEFKESLDAPERKLTESVGFKVAEVIATARNSLNFLASMALPLVFQFMYPPVFIAVWTWLISFVHKKRDFSKLALGLPRGFGKTTLMKLFVLYCILFTERKFILVISATATLAENFIADVVDMLDEPNIKKVFGDWRVGIEKDTQPLKKFGFRGRNIILAGIGAEGSLRGLNLKNERPDVMIFEDVQTREVADSKELSEKLERWMLGTAMKAKSPFGCLYIFVANMYPTKWSILRHLKDNSQWVKFIAGGLLEDGSSLWEELQPAEQLIQEFQADLESGHPEIFFAEVLNDENAASSLIVDLSQLPPIPYSPTDIPQGKFIVIDPAGMKKKSNKTAIGYCEIFDGKPVLRSLVNEILSPGDTIREALKLALDNNCRFVAIEGVAYQATLAYWFRVVTEQLGISGIEVGEVYPGGLSKNSRIVATLKAYGKGDFFIDPSVRPEAHLQIAEFQPLKTDNDDDILDLLVYMPKVQEEFGMYLETLEDISGVDYSTLSIVPMEINSPF